MIIYSVTVSVEQLVATEWLEWMQHEHLPEVMQTGCFEKYQLHRLVEPIFEPDTVTFNVLYYANSAEQLEAYRNDHSPRLRHHAYLRYGEQATAVRSVLEVLQSS
ncbi:MAG: DUF4286 domain-containing protein [Candidatus Melainabacteria bacterium HGW-Melainabacteria-1]|nr:MAG: DUF4286 domain-containing protein [Candidatus Melainabacteria bacterium HGW-Melainabacteria-1]